ncbi:hypothetical protein [Winogradskyella ludwigii]|jgi:hypothetical protein|uniref:hypothetical protein n=1 Tax=Winogradskyella ludwigii TaxID=2686076 RepID=UPI0015CAA1AF|nr:hypothetical protein [Winogradskyella ludwigii]
MLYSSQATLLDDLNSENDFRYCLKFELIEFCKENDLPTHGSKVKIRARIENFLNRKSKKNAREFLLKNKRRVIKKIA